ncbi:MAG: LysR family transcriptional regulator [Acidobacteria bacterium]|nr:MAG: LysR family transcriptional regulator [Acidobacteriota bacterium]PYY06841.1 MAG: LysR family transcriptional regulator [Acidobacteriota bacterium]PYY21263.1 MAG: LysR family transcriptional regulator [Acidobacteriota bacterium]
MDLDQLNSFLEVAKHSSFSKAAERCFRTQPAISSQIRALEEEVGAKLFDRSGAKVSLTVAGKAFQTYAEEALRALRSVKMTIAEMERTPRGEIVVGANEATCLYVLPEVFADFKRQYPKVSVSIQRAETAKTLESVIDQTVDFGVVSMPVKDSRLDALPIHHDELVLITSPGHALAQLSHARLEEIAKYPLVLPKLGRTRDAIDDVFEEARLKLHVSMELDSSELLKRFVAADVGVGFVARSNISDEIRAGTLSALSFIDPPISRDLALVHRKDKTLSRAARAFMEIAVNKKAVHKLAHS